MCEKERNVGRTSGSNGIGPAWRSHFGPTSAEFEGKSRRGPNYWSRSFEINEANKIRELCRALCKIPENEKEKDANKRKEVGKEWQVMGEISEVNSADKIGQLEALRFEMKSGNYKLPNSKIDAIFGKWNAANAGGNSKGRNLQ